MEQNKTTSAQQGYLERNRTWIKGLLIGFLILLMMIPAAFISGLVNERAARQDQVTEEISSKWAGPQTIKGPVLVLPYYISTPDKEGKMIRTREQAYFLPDNLDIRSRLQPEVRKRSLYDVTLYRTAVIITGTYKPLDLGKLNIEPAQVIWEDVRLMIGINDARGLEEEISFTWNSRPLQMETGVPGNDIISKGLNVPVLFDSGGAAQFSMSLSLKGSGRLYFTPVGKTTTVSMTAPWKDPSFDGNYLPSEKPDISDSGFSAGWKIMDVSRDYPQSWKGSGYDIGESAFGVRLIQPTDNYTKTERSVKYALLFISLTFTVFFFLEILQKKQIHPLQYILVGLALCIFYTLLLSISEYTGFNPAYIIASLATILLVGFYTSGVFKSRKTAYGFSAALTLLYTYIFILIQLQDYALIFGSIGLFLILSVLMFYSRKIDWYQTSGSSTH